MEVAVSTIMALTSFPVLVLKTLISTMMEALAYSSKIMTVSPLFFYFDRESRAVRWQLTLERALEAQLKLFLMSVSNTVFLLSNRSLDL